MGSRLISSCPASTRSPSRTWICATVPASGAWTTLTCPLGTTLPGALTTISTRPNTAHDNPAQNRASSSQSRPRPAGEGGCSCTSSAAGRNCR
ncbi:MAG: hypothetical protein U5K56_14900 [Halioglobus sp.]|nr:hypothetical protein [Halioglobus sp.]